MDVSTNVRQSRSKSRSPRNSISSSKRRALHARSDSDTNELAGKHAAGVDEIEDQIYRQSPFPRLPSQILSPKGSLSIFEDQTATAASGGSGTSIARPLPGSRIPRVASPRGRVKSKALVFNDASAADSSKAVRRLSSRAGNGPALDPLHANPVPVSPISPTGSARSGRASSRVRSLVSAIESAKGENGDSLPPTPKPPTPKARVIKPSSFVAGRAPELSVPVLPPIFPQPETLSMQIERASSPVRRNVNDQSELSKTAETGARSLDSPVSPVNGSRPWEQALPVLSSTLKLQPSTSIGSLSNAEHRPRSASTPTAPTDAFLAALVAEGTVVQYPKLDKRSITSLRTDTSSVRGAFPRPLNLRRKRARSHLSRAESVASEYDEYDTNTGGEPISSRLVDNRPYTPPRVIEPDSGRWTPGRWTAELEDTVAPLDRHPLRAQHSYYRDRERNRDREYSDSRPTSRSSIESTTSSSGGFYRFLNDSRTAWAKSYYCNEGALRLVTPPHVIQMSSIRLPTTPASRSYTASGSGPTQTPESDGYVESIYIPRSRPLQARPAYDEFTIRPTSSEEALPPSSIRSMSSPTGHDLDSNNVQHEPLPGEPAQAVRRESANIFGPMPRPRPEARLSPDRGVSARYSLLQAPSLDGTSWRSPVNVQVGMLIFGIVFPFAWMVAACLPLPPRPHIVQAIADAERFEVAEDVNDCFLQEDIKRWQKVRWWRNVNRFMSFTGLCVIATIIALAIVGTH